MEDIIDIIVTETTNLIEITSQPTDEIIDVNIIDNREDVTLNVTPTLVEININSLTGNFGILWGEIEGTLSNQTDLQNALNLKADLVDGKVPSSQLPSYVDDVVEVANYAALPVTGEVGKIYITLDTNYIYRWTGSTYVEIKDSSAVWGAITGTLSNQTDLQNALNLKANDNAVVHLAGTETITGAKTFSSAVIAPNFVLSGGTGNTGLYYGHTDRVVLANYTTGGIDFEVNGGSIVATLFPSGNYGLGITLDAGYKLDVNGTTRISGALSGTSASFSSSVTASSLIKSGGTSSQFLKADGSVDSTSYQTLLTNPVTGTGTSGIVAVFNGTSSITDSSIYANSTRVSIGADVTTTNRFTAVSSTTSAYAIVAQASSAANGIWSNVLGTGEIFRGQTAGGSYFIINNGGNAFLNGNLNVGDFASTSYRLNVVGTANITGAATFSSSVTAGSWILTSNNLFTGGNNTGVFLTGSSSDFSWGLNRETAGLTLYAGSAVSPKMTITTSGNVGIGTTSPSHPLTISAVTANTSFYNTFSNASNRNWALAFGIGALGDFNIMSSNAEGGNPISAGTTRLNIQTNGNVGIGTTSPNSGLHISSGATRGLRIDVNSGVSGFSMSPNGVFGIDEPGVGNGRFIIATNGNVGIGLTNPQTQFHINGVMTFSEAGFDTVRLHKIVHGHSDGNNSNNYIAFQVSDGSGTTAERFRTDGNGNLIHKSYSVGQGILWSYSGGATYGFYNANNGTFVLTNSGVANVGSFNMSSGAYTALSDANKKKDFEFSNYGLAEVMQLKPTLFRYKTDSSNAKKDLGFIAQEVKDIIPQAYVESEGFIGLNDRPIIAVLTKAIQELKAELDTLKNK